MPEAFFTVDGDSYVPGRLTQGPWGAAMGGQIVGGLLGWGIEKSGVDPDFQPARLTVDLLRPALLQPVQIRPRCSGKAGASGWSTPPWFSAARSSRGPVRCSCVAAITPTARCGLSVAQMPPLPTSSDGFGATCRSHLGIRGHLRRQSRYRRRRMGAVALAEVRLGAAVSPDGARPPADAVYPTGFRRRYTSSLTHWGTSGLRYINADYTVTASRLPDGEFLGLAAQSHYGTAGVATGAATLFDRHGPIGTSSALAVAQPAGAFKPSYV